jgi:hypothetical protein
MGAVNIGILLFRFLEAVSKAAGIFICKGYTKKNNFYNKG